MGDHLLIMDMREKARSKNEHDQFLALLFALQIPSICSRIEIPRTDKNSGKPNEARDNPAGILYNVNGKPFDKNLYFAWLQKHRQTFEPWFFRVMPFEVLCEAIYDLRNDVTHSGNLLESDGRIVLIESDDFDGLFSGRRLYMSISQFCDTMFDAAREVFSDDSCWPPKISKAEKNLSLYPLPGTDFQQIRRDLEMKYNEFWKDREDEDDLRLYQAYHFTMMGHLDEIERCMAEKPKWTFGELSRLEMERLVKVVHECDVFIDELDAEIAQKYFKRDA